MKLWELMKKLMEDLCVSGNRPGVTTGQQCHQSGCEMGLREGKMVPKRTHWKPQVHTRPHICLPLSPNLRCR